MISLKKTSYLVFLFLLFLPGYVAASGDHQGGAQPGAHNFRLDNYQINLNISPVFLTDGVTPKVVLSLKKIKSSAPALDADIYIMFAAKAKPAMTEMDTAASPPTTTREASGNGLDFDIFENNTPPLDLTTFVKLLPTQQAGTFSGLYPLDSAGDYSFTIVVKRLDDKVFIEPLIYGGDLAYIPKANTRQYRMLSILAVLIISSLIFLVVMLARQSLSLTPGKQLNLLDIDIVRRFLGSKWYQPAFQIPTFLFFLIIIYIGINDVQMGDKNVATILTWTIWWAGVIFTFVLLGRVWCMMCPFGAAQDVVGRRLSLNKNFPRPMRNIWLSTILFLSLTWWDSYSGIVNKPALTAYLFIAFFIVSVITALVYKKRTFCRYICPLGGLIGLYSMFSPLELRNKSLHVCKADKAKGCMRGTASSYACPMFETPMTLDQNNYCNLCCECTRSCAEDNITVRFRSFGKDLWHASKGHMDEAYLAMALVGLTVLVTAEMVVPWHGWQDSLMKILPMQSLGVIGHSSQENFIFSFLLAMATIMPAILLLLASTLTKKLSGPDSKISIKEIFIRYAYMFIPIGLSMHLAHNTSHLLTEGQQVIPALQRALNKYLAMDLGEPIWSIAPFMGNESVFWLQMATMVVLNIFSLYAGYRISTKLFPDKATKVFIPMLLLAVAFMIVNIYILGQPMALRHSH